MFPSLLTCDSHDSIGEMILKRIFENCSDKISEWSCQFMFPEQTTNYTRQPAAHNPLTPTSSTNPEIPFPALDLVFRNLGPSDIANAQLVCRRWRKIISSRRHLFSQRHIRHLVVQFNGSITNIREKSAAEGRGIFGNPWRKSFPLSLEDAADQVIIDLLELRLTGDLQRLEDVHLDFIRVKTLKIRLAADVDHENSFLALFLDSVRRNPSVPEIIISKEVQLPLPTTSPSTQNQQSINSIDTVELQQ